MRCLGSGLFEIKVDLNKLVTMPCSPEHKYTIDGSTNAWEYPHQCIPGKPKYPIRAMSVVVESLAGSNGGQEDDPRLRQEVMWSVSIEETKSRSQKIFKDDLLQFEPRSYKTAWALPAIDCRAGSAFQSTLGAVVAPVAVTVIVTVAVTISGAVVAAALIAFHVPVPVVHATLTLRVAWSTRVL